MNVLNLTYKGQIKTIQGASVWSEVTKEQLLLWVAVMHGNANDEIKLQMALLIFYGIDLKTFFKLKEAHRIQLTPSLKNLISRNSLYRWLIPSIKVRFKRYYGPADALRNLTAHEFFNVCEPLYFKYKADNNPDTLNALCAALYREKRQGLIDNDIRCDLTDEGIEKRLKKFRRVRMNTKLAIAFNYEGCRNSISAHRDYKLAFEGKQGKSKRKGDVTLSLAGGPLGDHEKTKKTNLYTFLLHLVNLIEQEDELKSKQ